jgi:hypothetical protein
MALTVDDFDGSFGLSSRANPSWDLVDNGSFQVATAIRSTATSRSWRLAGAIVVVFTPLGVRRFCSGSFSDVEQRG